MATNLVFAWNSPRFPELAFVLAVTWFVSGNGVSSAVFAAREWRRLGAAVLAGALVGPAQVGARLLEFGFLRHVHPLLPARLAALAHPLGAIATGVFSAAAAAAFGLFHGAGDGILTLAKGTVVSLVLRLADTGKGC